MKWHKKQEASVPAVNNRIAMRGGSYSLIISAVVLALLIVLNIMVTALPTTLTKYDISSSQLYSITSNTKAVVNNLTQDVTIYWIVQADAEDDIIQNLLDKYESLSSYIEVVKKNPDVFPTFTQTYTSENVPNNSLIVESSERYRYVPYDDIYQGEMNYYTGGYNYTEFDGEGAITSAIDYVTTEDLPVVYTLEGHGESELPSIFAEQVEKENIEVASLSLLTIDEIPEDADAIVIYSPTSDISEEERDMLAEYAENGGKLMVMAGPTEDGTLTTLYSLLSAYGVEAVDGIVVENDRSHYAFGYPYVLLPDMASHAITDSLIESNYYAILPIAQGLSVNGSTDATVTELLTTSDVSFCKAAGFSLTTYEKEEGDTDGPFAVAVSIETANGGGIVWFASSDFLNDMYNAYSSSANGNLAMNALSSLIGEREAIAIRSKSLNYNYLTISDSTSTVLKTLMIGVFPLLYLGIGVCVLVVRKKVQNETV